MTAAGKRICENAAQLRAEKLQVGRLHTLSRFAKRDVASLSIYYSGVTLTPEGWLQQSQRHKAKFLMGKKKGERDGAQRGRTEARTERGPKRCRNTVCSAIQPRAPHTSGPPHFRRRHLCLPRGVAGKVAKVPKVAAISGTRCVVRAIILVEERGQLSGNEGRKNSVSADRSRAARSATKEGEGLVSMHAVCSR